MGLRPLFEQGNGPSSVHLWGSEFRGVSEEQKKNNNNGGAQGKCSNLQSNRNGFIQNRLNNDVKRWTGICTEGLSQRIMFLLYIQLVKRVENQLLPSKGQTDIHCEMQTIWMVSRGWVHVAWINSFGWINKTEFTHRNTVKLLKWHIRYGLDYLGVFTGFGLWVKTDVLSALRCHVAVNNPGHCLNQVLWSGWRHSTNLTHWGSRWGGGNESLKNPSLFKVMESILQPRHWTAWATKHLGHPTTVVLTHHCRTGRWACTLWWHHNHRLYFGSIEALECYSSGSVWSDTSIKQFHTRGSDVVLNISTAVVRW